MRHLISAKQFTDVAQLDSLFKDTDMISCLSTTYDFVATRKVMASLFYQPSTRTRFSFETAMTKLGGGVISSENAAEFSSAVKGESLADTVRVVSEYANVIILRHPVKGSAELATKYSPSVIINAGDGEGEHPTQALLDIYTIRKELGRVDGIHIAMVGDMLYGRTVHSLIYLLSLYKDVRLTVANPPQLHLPDYLIHYIRDTGFKFRMVNNLSDAMIDQPDVVYMTRAQRKTDTYDKDFIFGTKEMEKMGEKSILLHPLPRITEIDPAVDSDRRAAYFRQARNGLFVRMAILYQLFDTTTNRGVSWEN